MKSQIWTGFEDTGIWWTSWLGFSKPASWIFRLCGATRSWQVRNWCTSSCASCKSQGRPPWRRTFEWSLGCGRRRLPSLVQSLSGRSSTEQADHKHPVRGRRSRNTYSSAAWFHLSLILWLWGRSWNAPRSTNFRENCWAIHHILAPPAWTQ